MNTQNRLPDESPFVNGPWLDLNEIAEAATSLESYRNELATIIESDDFNQYTSERFKYDDGKDHYVAEEGFSEFIANDKLIALAFIKKYPRYIAFFSEELKNDKELAMLAAKSHRETLDLLGKDIQDDKEVVNAEVIGKYGLGYMFEFESERLRKDRDYIITEIYHG